MNESQWLRSQNPETMLGYLQGKASERKLRLLACACVSTFCRKLTAIGWRVLRGAERAADSPDHRAHIEGLEVRHGFQWAVLGADAWRCARVSTTIQGVPRGQIAPVIREIFGNPFATIVVDPGWLRWNDRVAGNLARTIYRKRAFEQLPILADALEDAGCTSQPLLEHCRLGAGHHRGCWALDLLLGKG